MQPRTSFGCLASPSLSSVRTPSCTRAAKSTRRTRCLNKNALHFLLEALFFLLAPLRAAQLRLQRLRTLLAGRQLGLDLRQLCAQLCNCFAVLFGALDKLLFLLPAGGPCLFQGRLERLVGRP